MLCALSPALWAADSSTDWMDRTVSPGSNFYQYANGNWQKQNPIPPEYSIWGTFSVLNKKNEARLHQLLLDAAADKSARPGSLQQKVGDFYYSGMDEATINRLGYEPLKPMLAQIESIRSIKDLQDVATDLQKAGVDVLFGFGSMQDYKNSEQVIGVAQQAGLGLPDRDYYLKDDEKFRAIRAAYVQHISRMFVLLGDEPAHAEQQAKRILSIETDLAKASMSQTDQRDPHAVYNIMDRKQLAGLTPVFSWPEYFTALGQSDLQRINVAMPEFFKAMNQQLQAVSIDDWKSYLRWHLIDAFAPYLSQPFVDQNFWMTSQLTGAKKLLPRWKRVVATEEGALGFAIGKLYVERYFSASDKKEVLEILHAIRKTLEQDLQTLAWMTPATRSAALKKLAMIEERVGYPDKWWDYSKLVVDKGPYVSNVIRANRFLIERDLNKIGKSLDRSEWAMTPQTINAYYDPSMNNINLPAGILQPPFFDPEAPPAVNYGAIGFVIGHELTHGFDDQGAQFDGKGNLNDWWTAEDLTRFKQATDCIVKQYSAYTVADGLPVQGKLVVGEATADLGGVTLAYRAFQSSPAYKQAATINGITPDQQFFLSVAHVWASNIRPEQARNQVTTDPHPPAIYRVNGTLANMPEFQKAFDLPDNAPMINRSRCVIW
ncbi:M13 family metallopeptidase [Legionella sp. CNM-4043-24]|uniref:M13 family metallopeptidase n=1 Tax=Legionella sp. CNM-4043-24 TaxID=3421646 RepID=UPI00403AB3D4